MTFKKRNIENETELFYDLCLIAKECTEEAINNSVMMFFENGEEIIKNKKTKEAYREIISFLENHKIMKIYTDENLSCMEKALILTYFK